MENKKAELLRSIESLTENKFIGIYYIDVELNLYHYSVYSFNEVSELKEKLEKFNNSLSNSLTKIILWRVSDSIDYLKGIYDGITGQI